MNQVTPGKDALAKAELTASSAGGAHASVFRLERVLSHLAPELAAAWIASYTTSLRTRLLRVGGAMLGVPARQLAMNATAATRLTWMGLEGMSRDRIETLGESYARDRILNKLGDSGQRLLRDAKKRGDHLVLISNNIDAVVRHVAEALEITTYACNHIEYVDERATGRLVDPVINGTTASRWLREWAKQHDVDLNSSRAFGGLAEDMPLLSAVGAPCVVNPDRSMRSSAENLDWPAIL